MVKEEDWNKKKKGEEKGGGKESRKWRWRQTRECATTGLIWLRAQCRGGMQSWGREGEKQADKCEGINGRECRVHVRGMRLSGSKILSWTLGDYPTGHHLMDYGLQVIGRQHCSSVSLTNWEMLRVIAEWRRLWLLRDQPWGTNIIYKRFQEFTAFLNCRYKTLIISGPLLGCRPDPYRTHLLTTKCGRKKSAYIMKQWQETC